MGLFHDKPSWQNPFYTVREEIANSVTHGVGAALSAAGLVTLIVLASLYGDVYKVVGFTIFGASLLILYSASTLYHAIQHRGAKRILRRCDHAAVYLLIAGTYTPFLLISLRGTIGLPLLALVWAMALLGLQESILIDILSQCMRSSARKCPSGATRTMKFSARRYCLKP